MATKRSSKDKITFIATAGILLALILVFMLVPISLFGVVNLAVVAIIAVIIACQHVGIWMGLFMGLAFGIASLISSYTTGAGQLLAVAFQNPLISIAPRVLVSVTCYFSYVGMRKLLKLIYSKKKGKFDEKKANRLSIIVSSTVSAIIAVTTNTALVMSLIFAFHGGQTINGTVIGLPILIATLSFNYPIELAISAVASPAILIGLKHAFKTMNSDKLAPVNSVIEVEDNCQ